MHAGETVQGCNCQKVPVPLNKLCVKLFNIHAAHPSVTVQAMLPLSIDKSRASGNKSFNEKRNLYGKMPKYCAAPNGAPLTNVRSLNEKHILYAKRLNHCVEPTKVPFTHVKSAGIPTWKQTCVLATLIFLGGAAAGIAAGIAVASSQKNGAPPPPPPPLPPPSPFTVLPPQSPPIYGCTDSTQLGYLADATFDDGSCIQPIYGCVHSLALNFNATANVDDGSCEFTSVHGTIALFGYLQNCRVVVDGFGDGFSQAAEPGPEDPWARSNNLGHYTVHYLDEGLVGVQPAMPAAGFPCTDSITQDPLKAPLRTGQNASMATLLTTVAIDIRQMRQAECIAQGHGGSSLATCLSVGGKDIDTYLADTVCRNLVPPVPCSFSSQPCNVATGYVDSCVLDGAPISVWHFDALRQYISDSTRDPAWFAWIVAQVNIAFTVDCAKTSLVVRR